MVVNVVFCEVMWVILRHIVALYFSFYNYTRGGICWRCVSLMLALLFISHDSPLNIYNVSARISSYSCASASLEFWTRRKMKESGNGQTHISDSGIRRLKDGFPRPENPKQCKRYHRHSTTTLVSCVQGWEQKKKKACEKVATELHIFEEEQDEPVEPKWWESQTMWWGFESGDVCEMKGMRNLNSQYCRLLMHHPSICPNILCVPPERK